MIIIIVEQKLCEWYAYLSGVCWKVIMHKIKLRLNELKAKKEGKSRIRVSPIRIRKVLRSKTPIGLAEKLRKLTPDSQRLTPTLETIARGSQVLYKSVEGLKVSNSSTFIDKTLIISNCRETAQKQLVKAIVMHKNTINSLIFIDAHIFSASSDYIVRKLSPSLNISTPVLKFARKAVSLTSIDHKLIAASCAGVIKSSEFSLKLSSPLTLLDIIASNQLLCFGKSIKFIDLPTLKAFREPAEEIYMVRSAKIHSERTFLTGSDGIIKLWDLRAQRQIFELQAHNDFVTGLLTENTKIFSCSLDTKLCEWDIRKLQKITEKSQQTKLAAMAKYGEQIITAGEKVIVWGGNSIQLNDYCKTLVCFGEYIYAGSSAGIVYRINHRSINL